MSCIGSILHISKLIYNSHTLSDGYATLEVSVRWTLGSFIKQAVGLRHSGKILFIQELLFLF